MRPALSIHARGRRQAARPLAERMLEWTGADPAMAECVLGDLAEERAERAVRDGAWRAEWWYVGEMLRSAPWLLASAARRVGWAGRGRLAAAAAMVALLATAVVMLLLSIAGDPARLMAEADAGDGVVVNNVGAVKLGMRVLDARGHVLPDSGVRYRWAGGAPIPVSAMGVTRCTTAGDATVRATLGRISTDLVLRCRPVNFLAQHGVSLIVGEGAASIPFMALDDSMRRVTMLRGAITVHDTSIVALERAPDGQRLLRARAPGFTRAEVTVGDRSADVFVEAFRRVSSPAGIRPGARVALRASLHAREVREWTLPPSRELYFVRMLPDGDDEEQMPAVAIIGAKCVDFGRHAFMCAVPWGAKLYAYYPTWGDQSTERRGNLTVARAANP